jgi:hypothetical protein
VATLAGSGSHGDHLILGEPGILYALEPPWAGASASCRKVLAAPGLDLRSLPGETSGEPHPRLPWVPTARAGRLELLAGEASSPTLRELHPVAAFPLPIAASRESWGIKLTGLPVHLVPALPAAAAPAAPPAPGQPISFSPHFAAGPEAQGERRLRTLLLSATAGQAPVEAWSLLPAAAQNVESRYSTWDGRPVLSVTSLPRFGIFVKRDVQLFLLARDRSRGGSPPVLAVHTDCHLWQTLKTYLADLTGTSRQDLVLIHPEGLSGKKLRFQVHANAGQGRLAAQPRSSSVDVEAGAWFYGADLTGDGVPDLLVRDKKDHLLLYPGVARAYRLANRPSWSCNLPVPAAPPRPAKHNAKAKEEDDGDQDGEGPARLDNPATRLAGLVDLRGDGRATLFLAVADAQGRSQVVAVRRVP